MNNGILLASGGLDSTTMFYWLKNQNIKVRPLFINFGQHCASKELKTLKSVLPKEKISEIIELDISDIYKFSTSKFINEPNLWEEVVEANDLYIPYRNTLILTIAASIAQSLNLDIVYSAFINSNHAKEIDCSNKFFDELNEHLTEYGSVKIEMPFRNKSKYEVAKIGLSLNVPIHKTYSCQAQSETPCGACPNCVDRLDALNKISAE